PIAVAKSPPREALNNAHAKANMSAAELIGARRIPAATFILAGNGARGDLFKRPLAARTISAQANNANTPNSAPAAFGDTMRASRRPLEPSCELKKSLNA